MTLHTYNPLPSVNFRHLTVSEIWPGQEFMDQGHYIKVKIHIKVTPSRCTPTNSNQDFIGQGHYGKGKGQIKVTSWHCKPTPPNQCPYQVSTSYTLWFLRYSPVLTWVRTIPRQPLRAVGLKGSLGWVFMVLIHRLNVYLKP